jgi:hypothetical protein
MESASRTLVMSPPELWEVIDQHDRMQGLMCALIGRATEVTVNQREPESVLRWEACEDADAWIEVQLSEKGWGTNVKLQAENGGGPTKLEGWLDAVLDELATPQKRPFEGISDAPPKAEPELRLEPEPEPAAVVAPVAETPEPDDPEPGTPEPETDEPEPVPEPEPARQGKLRRFFGL